MAIVGALLIATGAAAIATDNPDLTLEQGGGAALVSVPMLMLGCPLVIAGCVWAVTAWRDRVKLRSVTEG